MHVIRGKHGKVDNSWSMPSVEWSDSILCTEFQFCDEKIIGIINRYWSTIPSNLWWQYLHILEDDASGVQIGDIEQAREQVIV